MIKKHNPKDKNSNGMVGKAFLFAGRLGAVNVWEQDKSNSKQAIKQQKTILV